MTHNQPDMYQGLDALRSAVVSVFERDESIPPLWRARATIDWFLTGKPRLLAKCEWRQLLQDYGL